MLHCYHIHSIADMMSLVGCSGQEFSDILLALGYKAEKRDLPPTKEMQEKESAKVAESEAEKEPEPVVDKEPEVLPDAGDSEPAGKTEELEQTKDKADSKIQDASDEPRFLVVWWPQNTGPFRRNKPREKQPVRPQKKRPHPAGKGRPYQKRKPKPKVNIEDSPFAALAALKKNMKK